MAKKKDQPTGAYVAPNLDAYQTEIQRIQEAQAKRAAAKQGQFGSLYYYTWKVRDNNLLFLPPWDAVKREVFKRIAQMYKLPPDNETHICIEKTAPELNLVCPLLAVIREAEAAGHNVKRQWPAFKSHWQVLDLDGITKEVEVTENNVKVKKTINFRYQPQIISLPPSAHDTLFSFYYNPDIGDFTNPNAAIPVEIKKTIQNNGIPNYAVSPITNFEQGKKVIIRMAIAETVEMINQIIGTVVDGKLTGGLLYNLDNIYRLPTEALKAPDGKIYRCAMKLRAYYKLDRQAQAPVNYAAAQLAPGLTPNPMIPPPPQVVQIGTQMIPPVTQMIPPGTQIPQAPGIPVPTGTQMIPPAVIPVVPAVPIVGTPVVPVAPVVPTVPIVGTPVVPVVPVVPPFGTPAYKNPKDMNIPEDQLKGAAPVPVTFPGAPNCFGTFASTSISKAVMQNGQYTNGSLILDESATVVVCNLCPYKAVCQGIPAVTK